MRSTETHDAEHVTDAIEHGLNIDSVLSSPDELTEETAVNIPLIECSDLLHQTETHTHTHTHVPSVNHPHT